MTGDTPTPKFTVDQRKALADMLGPKSDALSRAKARYHKSRTEREEMLAGKLAEENGATKLLAKIADLRRKKDESESELHHFLLAIREAHGGADAALASEIEECEGQIEKLGFDVHKDGTFSLRWHADDLRQTIRERIEKEIGTEGDIEQKFEKARAQVVAVETAEAAAKIVESLL